EWTLRVNNPDGTPADASLLAVLYDKSLDAIKAHNWSFQPTNYPSQPSASWQFPSWYSWGVHAAQAYKFLSVRPLEYSRFDSTVYPSGHTLYIRGTGGLMKSRAMATAGAAPMNVQFDMAKKVESARDEMVAMEAEEEPVTEEGNGSGAEQVQVRENLAETAFFYPTLATDAQGQAVVRFTLPESLTTWRFMGVANTVDMNYGYIDGEAVAQKDVMVQPSIPRFVRQGDEVQLSARIFNTSDKAVSGDARLLLIDPESQSVVAEQSVPFSVEAGKTASVSYPLSVDYPQSLLICKVIASGDGFSDGEQHYLPVLPDREYVTKTVPYTQYGAGVKTIDLSKLFPAGTTQQKLTVEYTNNPAWLMVQSLPTVGQPSDHSAIDLAASYYSNLLAKTLLAQSPQVKTVFAQWKQERTDNTLLSQLEKDQELKDLLLGETPWVAAADRETEQKQRLADFFDENGIHNRLSQTLEKLGKLQNADGSFSWYSGMQGSTSVTVAVEEMLVRLNSMAGEQPATKQLQAKAFGYLGKEMVQLVAELKKEERKGRRVTFPSFTALRWLYLCAVDGRSLPSNVQAANTYLVALLKKDIKNQTLYEKALTAVVLAKHGDARKAAEYVRSLKEYSVYTEEMGRYYDTPRASYSWYDYKIPTEVAAIEAIQRVTPQDVQTVDEMRRWLLQEKRTQAWDTPINSVNAIYAFLNGQQQTLSVPKALTTLAVDGQPVDMPKATAGLGYVKTVVGNPSGQTFTATKT
ncbi:MAG: alpha-2-macroglobulin, partial [Prevotella sp.]|nr:alpha-2-macroglobulin [Prevotella sp.]